MWEAKKACCLVGVLLAFVSLLAQDSKAAVFTVGSGTPFESQVEGVWQPLVGTDELGRRLSSFTEVGAPRAERYVALFYFLWLGEHGDSGPFDITKITQQYPEAIDDFNHPAWGRETPPNWPAHFWGEPLFGYYRSRDPWVARRHVQLLADAGIDLLIFDTTNAVIYPESCEGVLSALDAVRAQGRKVPQVVFYTHSASTETMDRLYAAYYAPDAPHRHPETWFYWDGKPLIIGDLPSKSIRDFFTFRKSIWPGDPIKRNAWPWIEFIRPQRVYRNSADQVEIVNVSVAQHVTGNMSDGAFYGLDSWGRSYHDRANDKTPGAVNWGYNIAEQWEFALAQDPLVIFVTGWNEWIASPFQGDAQYPVKFVDEASQEFSRDIEPMQGGHGDNYYLQLADFVRKYKGVEAPPPVSEPKTIRINADFSQWADVQPAYLDYTGDTQARNFPGFGTEVYTNNSGRNDFAVVKAARDARYVYFYARTVAPITASTDPAWMRLYLNVDGDGRNGWKGYDFVVNRAPAGPASLTLEKSRGGWDWKPVASLPYFVQGNELHFAIPRKTLGIRASPLAIEFKWADNSGTDHRQQAEDVMDFYQNGDVVPEGRFNYLYTTDDKDSEIAQPAIQGKTLPIQSVSASGESAEWPAANAIDGDLASAWSTPPQDDPSPTGEEWLMLDLGRVQNVQQVKLTPRLVGRAAVGFPQDFRFETSQDGQVWQPVAGQSYTSYENPISNRGEYFLFERPAAARFVRLAATRFRLDEKGFRYYVQMAEVEIGGAIPGDPAQMLRGLALIAAIAVLLAIMLLLYSRKRALRRGTEKDGG